MKLLLPFRNRTLSVFKLLSTQQLASQPRSSTQQLAFFATFLKAAGFFSTRTAFLLRFAGGVFTGVFGLHFAICHCSCS